MTRRGRTAALGQCAVLCAVLCGGPLLAPALASVAAAQDLSLMFTTADAWRKLSAPRKTALAADFMRVFCVQQTMPPEALVACLDRAPDGEPYERAIGCVKQLAGSP